MSRPTDAVGVDMFPNLAPFPGTPGMSTSGTVRERRSFRGAPGISTKQRPSRRSQPKTNEVINRAYRTVMPEGRRFRSGQVAIVRRRMKAEDANLYELYTRAEFNQVLASETMQIPGKNPGDLPRVVLKWDSLKKIHANFNVLGMSYRTGVGKHLSTNTETTERVNTLSVHGWADELENSFGTSIAPGTKLWNMIKKVRLQDHFASETDESGRTIKRRRADAVACFQMINYGNFEEDYPPLRELEYTETTGPDKGCKKYGSRVYFARTNDTPLETSEEDIAAAHRSDNLPLPQMEVYIGQ